MAKPKKLFKASEDLAANTLLIAMAVSNGVSLWTGDGPIPPAMKFGLLAASIIGLLKYNLWHRSGYNPDLRRTMRTMESLQRIPSSDPDINSWLHTWKPEKKKEKQQFVFYGDVLLTPVHEEEFRAFMKTAVLRQNNARYGGRAWRIRSGESFQHIKINWVLSENYFINTHRPRYPVDLYHSIMTILLVTRLRRGVTRSGKSDYLVGEWSVDGYVEKAISRWLIYYPPITSSNRRSFLSQFVN